eukprot:scaffold2560_cov397-Prasinococcus_capsulatus_cf.AAC.1
MNTLAMPRGTSRERPLVARWQRLATRTDFPVTSCTFPPPSAALALDGFVAHCVDCAEWRAHAPTPRSSS